MATYKDVLITDDDLDIDGDDQAVIIYDLDVIVQDLIHAIRESGYLVEMVAERSDERRQLLIQKIILLCEDDKRIVPGTVTITADPENFTASKGKWALIADTYEFGEIDPVALTG